MSTLSSSSLQAQSQPPSVAALSLALNIPALREAIKMSPSEEPIPQDEWHERTGDVDLDNIYDEARKNFTVLDASVLIAQHRNDLAPSRALQSDLLGGTNVVGEYHLCLLELTLLRTAERASPEILHRSDVP
jgi:hypothetical protein